MVDAPSPAIRLSATSSAMSAAPRRSSRRRCGPRELIPMMRVEIVAGHPHAFVEVEEPQIDDSPTMTVRLNAKMPANETLR
jgi:hypothetical protein